MKKLFITVIYIFITACICAAGENITADSAGNIVLPKGTVHPDVTGYYAEKKSSVDGKLGIFTVSLGWSNVTMPEMNANFADRIEHIEAAYALTWPGIVSTHKKSDIGNAVQLAADIGFEFFPGIVMGPKLAYIGCFESGIEITSQLTGYSVMTTTEKLDTSLFSFMAGGSYNYSFRDTPVTIGAALYAGYGLANGTMALEIDDSSMDEKASLDMTGSGFTGEITGSVSYMVERYAYLILNFGYRYVDISKMRYSHAISNSFYGIYKEEGDLFKMNGETAVFNYSGFIVNIGMQNRF